MGSYSITITLPEEAVRVAEYLRSQHKCSETIADFLIAYGKRNGIK